MFVVRLVEWINDGSSGGGSGAGDVLQLVFLTRLETVGRRKKVLAALFYVCSSHDHEWLKEGCLGVGAVSKGVEKSAPVLRSSHMFVQLGAHLRAHFFKESSGGWSSVTVVYVFVQGLSTTRCSRASVLGP